MYTIDDKATDLSWYRRGGLGLPEQVRQRIWHRLHQPFTELHECHELLNLWPQHTVCIQVDACFVCRAGVTTRLSNTQPSEKACSTNSSNPSSIPYLWQSGNTASEAVQCTRQHLAIT